MTIEPMSPTGVGEKIRELMKEHDCSPREAAQRLAKDLSDDASTCQELVRSAFGVWALTEAERYRSRVGTRPEATSSQKKDMNRLERSKLATNPWDCEIVVGQGSNARRVRVGDLTKTDVEVIWRGYRRLAETHQRKSNHWKRIERQMEGDETLEDAADRLSSQNLDFLSAELGVKEIEPPKENDR